MQYQGPKKINGTPNYRKNEGKNLKKELKKYSKKCRKNQCWYNYKSKKCLPHFKKLTMKDPNYIQSPDIESPSNSIYNDFDNPFLFS